MSTLANFPKDCNVVIVAFGGWSDAAEAATDTLEILLDQWNAQEIAQLEGDNFYDYKESRPTVSTDIDGTRSIEWPKTLLFTADVKELPDSRVYAVLGDEPNLRWRTFCDEILEHISTDKPTVVLALGAFTADVSHTRPIPVTGTTSNPSLNELTGFEASRYEGPTGILGVLLNEAENRGLATMSLWAAVPHYVAGSPCPKATLSMLRSLEDLLDISIPMNDVVDDARAWQASVEDLISDDEDFADYVRLLEESQDTAELPEATGEAIAKEFERYLRRREH